MQEFQDKGLIRSYRALFLLILFLPLNLLAEARHTSRMATKPSTPASLPAPVPCSGCWIPPVKTSWQWQLSGTVNESFNVDMYDIDMFENDSATVASLHVAGRKVICYISAGSFEDWRPDANQFPPQVIGNPYDGWPGEWWLDIRKLNVLAPILQARMDLCKSKRFDGIEFDNVDGYTANTGFPLTYNDQLIFNTWLANEAHQRGLNVALKNDSDQVQDLLPYFDWELAEECFRYHECDVYVPFINAGKAVMDTEYRGKKNKFCPTLNQLQINGIRKRLDLDAWRKSCQ